MHWMVYDVKGKRQVLIQPAGDGPMPEIRVGNLVRHKSGGPIMLVSNLPPPKWGRWTAFAECVWVEDGKRQINTFPLNILQTVYADGSQRNYAETN